MPKRHRYLKLFELLREWKSVFYILFKLEVVVDSTNWRLCTLQIRVLWLFGDVLVCCGSFGGLKKENSSENNKKRISDHWESLLAHMRSDFHTCWSQAASFKRNPMSFQKFTEVIVSFWVILFFRPIGLALFKKNGANYVSLPLCCSECDTDQ